MPIDIVELFRSNGVSYCTEGNKHCAAGWVQVCCPYCRDTNYHMGFHLLNQYFRCWRCGWHPLRSTLELLTHRFASDLIREFTTEFTYEMKVATKKKSSLVDAVIFPPFTDRMLSVHREYLRSRDFDPEQLEFTWGLKGTSFKGWFPGRIIAPIRVNGRDVSYQGRSVHECIVPKYKACYIEEEVIHHKEIVYGSDFCLYPHNIVVVEGIMDAWRLGPGAVATFGVQYTYAQVSFIRDLVRKTHGQVVILFDTDADLRVRSQVLNQAGSLASSLCELNCKVRVAELEIGDPADLKPSEVPAIRKDLGLD